MADEIKTIPDELREKLESGCALLLRSMLDCQDASYGIDHFGAMAWFILAAAWKESCFLGHRLQRGQLFIGREIYAKKWHITERRFRTILTHLKNSGFLTIKTTSKGSIITICNYDTYQNFFKLIDQLRDQQVTSNRPASDHNQLNKELNNNTLTHARDFQTAEEIVKLHPKQRILLDDIKAVVAAVDRECDKPGVDREAVFVVMSAKTQAYAEAVSKWPGNRKRYITACKDFFDRGMYNDDPETWTQGDDKPVKQLASAQGVPVYAENERGRR